RLANLGDLEQVREMEAELEDRFGPLPELARNLMLQLRFKVLAWEAGVKSILTENERLMLHADWMEAANQARLQARLGSLAHVGRRHVSLTMGKDWQKRLRVVLEELQQERQHSD
ncbi:MAG TPA: hypothetical protein ENI37_02155, partial [Chloroflexi bacterium]|nr:hypothetical protein [Chloroflexota bacterium]